MRGLCNLFICVVAGGGGGHVGGPVRWSGLRGWARGWMCGGGDGGEFFRDVGT